MSLWSSIKKIFKKVLPILPVIMLFAGPSMWGERLFNFAKVGEGGLSAFVKKNIFKAIVWGYSIYNALNPKQPPTFSGGGDYSNEPVYSWSGATVTSQQNIPVQVVYGDWWVNNANVIDKEITNASSIDPKVTSLYLQKYDIPRSGLTEEDKPEMNIVNITNIENGIHKNLLIGFDEISGKHVYLNSTIEQSDGWLDFEYVGIGPVYVGSWERKFNTGKSSDKGNAHNKFLFTPEDGHILSFMNYDYASEFLFRLDIANKKVYIYTAMSILMNDSNEMFDYNLYNHGFYGRTFDSLKNCIVSNQEYSFHYNNITKYLDASTPVDQHYYMPSHNLRRDYQLQKFSSTENGSYDFHSLQFLRYKIKILDGVIHYHEEQGEFNLQLLIEPQESMFMKSIMTAINVPDTSSRMDYSSNSKIRFMIGLEYYKQDGVILYDNSILSDIQTSFEANTDYVNLFTNLGFFGLVGKFSSYTSSTTTPTTEQTEIFNLAYLSFSELYKGETVLIGTGPLAHLYIREDDVVYTPFPSMDVQIMRDRFPRIEKLSSQPQLANFYEIDSDGYRTINKSIGSIVSMILMDEQKQPLHVSYSFFACKCLPYDHGHRFDPFFVEITNFASLIKSNPYTQVENLTDPNNISLPSQNITQSDDVNKQVINSKTFYDIKNLLKESKIASNFSIDLVDGRGYYDWVSSKVGNQNTWEMKWIQRLTRDQIVFNSTIDKYVYDYGKSQTDPKFNHFYDFNNFLIAHDIIYVPEHQYHLIKVDNSWLPVRGWNQNIKWHLKEPKVYYYSLAEGDGYRYALDGGNIGNGTSLWDTLGYHYLDTYDQDKIYQIISNDVNNHPLPSGYVSDMDGQLPFGDARVLNSKLYWFDDNDILLNISDSKVRTQVSDAYLSEAKTQFINIGYWGNQHPSTYVNSLSYYEKPQNYQIPASHEARIIYQLVSSNNN